MPPVLPRTDLERRYDGPIPPFAAASPDWDCSPATRIANRRRWAWAHVRRLGHDIVRAGRCFRATGDPAALRRWTGLRRDLAHALASWAVFRDWTAAQGGRTGRPYGSRGTQR